MSNWEFVKKYWLILLVSAVLVIASLAVVGLKLALLIGAVRWLWG